MFHSIPAALIAGEVAFLVCASGDIYHRAYKAGAVLVGFFSHLILDEIWSVRVQGGRIGLKSSSGTAMKLWGDSVWANISCYGKLALLGVLVFNDPIWTTVSPEASKLHAAAAGVVQTFENRTNVQIPPVLLPRAGATGTARPNGAIPQNNAPQNNMQQYYQQPQQQYAAQRGYPQQQGYAQQQPQQPVYQYQQPWQAQTPPYGQAAPQQQYYAPQNYPAQNYAPQGYAPQGYPQQQYAPQQPNGWQQAPAAGAPLDPRVQYGPMTRRY